MVDSYIWLFEANVGDENHLIGVYEKSVQLQISIYSSVDKLLRFLIGYYWECWIQTGRKCMYVNHFIHSVDFVRFK